MPALSGYFFTKKICPEGLVGQITHNYEEKGFG